MAICQCCGKETESPQTVTLAKNGLIENKICCSQCYYIVQTEALNRKEENLICG